MRQPWDEPPPLTQQEIEQLQQAWKRRETIVPAPGQNGDKTTPIRDTKTNPILGHKHGNAMSFGAIEGVLTNNSDFDCPTVPNPETASK
jgi:hypothetical protein